jgi:hypothetical protein
MVGILGQSPGTFFLELVLPAATVVAALLVGIAVRRWRQRRRYLLWQRSPISER